MTTRCPSCFGQSKVMDSREIAGNRKRYRRCEHCGERWSTVEKLANEFTELTSENHIKDVERLLSEYGALQTRWRNVAREVIRGLLARQDKDIEEEDAA